MVKDHHTAEPHKWNSVKEAREASEAKSIPVKSVKTGKQQSLLTRAEGPIAVSQGDQMDQCRCKEVTNGEPEVRERPLRVEKGQSSSSSTTEGPTG